ncbi:MAG: histidine kinase [Atopobiaceae bacterium]|nr:histidine kinase [Atopobiaceae bacterium]
MYGVRGLNVSIELWSAAFCIVGIISVLFLTRAESRYRTLFIAAFSEDLLCAGGDAIAGIFRGASGSLAWAATHVGNFFAFINAFMLVATSTLYLCARIKDEGGTIGATWPNVVESVATLMCILTATGLFYRIDENNLYHRENLYWLMHAFIAGVSLINAIIIFSNRGKLRPSTRGFLLLYTLLPFVASLFQAFIYGLNFSIIACTIGLMAALIELQAYSASALLQRTEELAQSQLQLSESRVTAFVSLVQPQFLFETLDAIRDLCDTDTTRTKQALDSFSSLLHANLDSLASDMLIPVTEELDHARTYLELVELAHEGRIRFRIIEPAQDFSVPPLTVQMLVEHAVTYSLAPKDAPGTITVCTGEALQEYWVSVVDDGIGFDVAQSDDVTHAGLRNSRTRLAQMCGGSLDVTSSPTSGTTVLMHIPKHRNDHEGELL